MMILTSHLILGESIQRKISMSRERNSDDDAKMEAFIALCDGIERNAIGNTMKQQMIETGVVKKCLDYLMVRNQFLVSVVHHSSSTEEASK